MMRQTHVTNASEHILVVNQYRILGVILLIASELKIHISPVFHLPSSASTIEARMKTKR